MAIETTSTLTASIRARYFDKYLESAGIARVYDQIAVPYTDVGEDEGKTMAELMAGSSIVVPFLSDMTPGTTVISETEDVVPQILRDADASVTPTSRAEALQWSENLDIQAYTNYGERRYKAVGKNMMETVELLAQAAATKGSWVERTAARAALDAGEATHLATDSLFRKFQAKMLAMNVPGFRTADGQANTFAAIMHPYSFHDICEGGNVDAIGIYQDMGIHLNFEMGKIGPFRLVVSPFAKVFGGAGMDNATAVADTLNGAVKALDKTLITVGDVSANVAKGEWWTIGTEETGNDHFANNERIKPVSAVTYTITFIGEGENGGLRFDHASGVAVRNADSVYTIVFAGPESLVKVYATDVGEYGMTVGPKKTGRVDQWASLGWKFYGQYGRPTEHRLLRHESATSYEA